MGETLSDFSQLSRSMFKREKPVEKKPAEDKPREESSLTDAEADVLAYFSKGAAREIIGRKPAASAGVVDPVAELEAKIADKDNALGVLAGEKTALEKSVAALTAENSDLRSALEQAKSEIAGLKAECGKLQDAARDAADDGASSGSEPGPVAAPTEAAKPAGGILSPVTGVDEMFAGEMREMVLAALAEARDSAGQSGRDRRAALLGALLEGNAASGELDRRCAELRQILKDAGSFADAQTIGALGKLGFRLISGKKHWKLEYANVRMPLAKTPSDYRSNRNATNEIANRCF